MKTQTRSDNLRRTRPMQSPRPLRRANFRARGSLSRARNRHWQRSTQETSASDKRITGEFYSCKEKGDSLVQRKQIKGHRVHQHPSPLVSSLLGSSQRAFCRHAWHMCRFEYALPAITCNSKAFLGPLSLIASFPVLHWGGNSGRARNFSILGGESGGGGGSGLT